MRWISRAWSDTQNQLGSWSGIFLLACGPILALFAHYLLFGRDEMTEELNPFISALAGLGVASIALFMWNLLASPYRMERDRADDADIRISANEGALGSLTERLATLEDRRAHLTITPKQFLYGGIVPDNPDLAPFCVFAYLKNSGELPSAAIGWHLKFRKKSGETNVVAPSLADNVSMGHINLRHTDCLYEKSIFPTPGGGLISGYIFAMMTRAEQDECHQFQICCEQTDGRTVESEWQYLEHEKESDKPMYHPGMGNPFEWNV